VAARALAGGLGHEDEDFDCACGRRSGHDLLDRDTHYAEVVAEWLVELGELPAAAAEVFVRLAVDPDRPLYEMPRTHRTLAELAVVAAGVAAPAG
jgi:hypothetical protein